MPDLVIFDCDGVLVDSERLAVVVEARMLTELGWPHTTQDVVRRYLGRSAESVLADLELRLGPELARAFDTRSTAEVHAAFERDLVAVPGVTDVVAWLRERGTPTCVASSGSHAKMRVTLGLTGLLDGFEGRIYSASDVRHGKPEPDLFLHAARQMGSAPSRCAVIEDSVFGVQAAVSAGMTAYGFAGGLTEAAALSDAGAIVFEEMSELPGLLRHSSEKTA